MRMIKRYTNRKLYDTEAKCYVTLEDLAELICEGHDIQVHDNGTGEDWTAITLTQILFDMEKKEVTICRAGHNKALIGTNGKLEYLDAEGIGLGLERGPVFESTLKAVHKPLHPGSVFFFYTDGLTEAMNTQQVQLGEEAVLSLVQSKRHLSAVELQQSITTAVEEFVGEAERHDDLTMVVVKVD